MIRLIVLFAAVSCAFSSHNDGACRFRPSTGFGDVCKIEESARIRVEHPRTYFTGETFNITCESECGEHHFQIIYVDSNGVLHNAELISISVEKDMPIEDLKATLFFTDRSADSVDCGKSQNNISGPSVVSKMRVTTDSSGTYIITCINRMRGFSDPEVKDTFAPTLYSEGMVVNVNDSLQLDKTTSSIVYQSTADLYLSSTPMPDPSFSCSCDYNLETTSRSDTPMMYNTPIFSSTLTDNSESTVTSSPLHFTSSKSSILSTIESAVTSSSLHFTSSKSSILSTIADPTVAAAGSSLPRETVIGIFTVALFVLLALLIVLMILLTSYHVKYSRLKSLQQRTTHCYNPVSMSPASPSASSIESNEGGTTILTALTFPNENTD